MAPSEFEQLKRANEARVLEAERVGSGVVDAWPIDFVFEFTGTCNLHCFMCGYEMLRDDLRDAGRKKFEIPITQFRDIAKSVFPHVRTINPTMSGEPLALTYFDEFLDEIAKYECKLKLYTNGMLLRGDKVAKMMPLLESLTISFDGATKQTFDYVRTGAKFEQVMENLKNFSRIRREMGLRKDVLLGFSVTLLECNVVELAEIIEIAAEHDVDHVTAGFVIAANERVQNESPLNDPARTNRELDRARIRASELGLSAHFPDSLAVNGVKPPKVEVNKETPSVHVSSGYPEKWEGKYYCDMAWRRSFVGLDGEVSPCCSPSRPIFGNAFQQDFFELWNGPGYQKLRRGLFTGDLEDYCKRCPFLQKNGSVDFSSDAYVFSAE